MTILDELADHAKERVAKQKEIIPYETVKAVAQSLPKMDFPFERALQKDGLSFICECKKASPS